MLTRTDIKSVVLFPFSIPAIIAFASMDKEARQKVEEDVLMYWQHTVGAASKTTWKMWYTQLVSNNTFRNVFYCRVSNLWRVVLPWFLKPHPSLNINPDLRYNYGGGIYIAHGESCRIEPQSLGKNSWIHQNVTIGMKGEFRPIIGDNVYIGCGAVLIGKCVIGNNVRIGANAVVVDEVIPDNATVCGPKAKIVRIR